MAPKRLCLTTAVAPVPGFLGGSCPLGCSLSAPATGGLSMVSPQHLRYAAGSEKEKGAGGRLHGGTIAHPFVFCNGGVADPLPNLPPSTRAGTQLLPAGAAPPAPCLGEGWGVVAWGRGIGTLPSLPPHPPRRQLRLDGFVCEAEESAFSLSPTPARRGQDRGRFTVRISVTPRRSTALLSVGVTQFMGRSVGGHPAAPGTGEGVQA